MKGVHVLFILEHILIQCSYRKYLAEKTVSVGLQKTF